jgi:hypothetical protein
MSSPNEAYITITDSFSIHIDTRTRTCTGTALDPYSLVYIICRSYRSHPGRNYHHRRSFFQSTPRLIALLPTPHLHLHIRRIRSSYSRYRGADKISPWGFIGGKDLSHQNSYSRSIIPQFSVLSPLSRQVQAQSQRMARTEEKLIQFELWRRRSTSALGRGRKKSGYWKGQERKGKEGHTGIEQGR